MDSIFWSDVGDECNNKKLSARVKLIAHDIYDVNDKLEVGQYFYKDIKKEGKILYNSGNFELAHEKPINKERKLKIVKEYYEERFKRVQIFYETYEDHFNKQYYITASFMLHQSAEACYQILFFIFANYIPREHYLEVLNPMAHKIDEKFKTIFPKKSDKKNYAIFELLDYAYIGARHDVQFKITKEECEYISKCVEKLIELTEEVCLKEIKSLSKG